MTTEELQTKVMALINEAYALGATNERTVLKAGLTTILDQQGAKASVIEAQDEDAAFEDLVRVYGPDERFDRVRAMLATVDQKHGQLAKETRRLVEALFGQVSTKVPALKVGQRFRSGAHQVWDASTQAFVDLGPYEAEIIRIEQATSAGGDGFLYYFIRNGAEYALFGHEGIELLDEAKS